MIDFELYDENGYPSEEFLEFIKKYDTDIMPILDLIDLILEAWNHKMYKLYRKYKDHRKLELHTGGWSGNEDIISVIKENVYLTDFSMKYIKWEDGGHYTFKIKC